MRGGPQSKGSFLLCCSDTLVDFLGEPYPPSIQAARREGRLGRMSEAEVAVDLRAQPGMLPNALIQAGPTLTAAAWQSQVWPHSV